MTFLFFQASLRRAVILSTAKDLVVRRKIPLPLYERLELAPYGDTW
jgi:hypothetical protein